MTDQKQTDLPTIATFWTGAPLGFVEQLCLTSWVDAGHPVILYSYEHVIGLPDGVKRGNATDVLPQPDAYTVHARTGSPAPFSDRFRYNLLRQQPGIIWADTDAYCLRPFTPVNGYLYGWESHDSIATGVLALPPDSPTLDHLIAYCDDPFAVLPWLGPKTLHEATLRAAKGDPMHVTEFPWGIWGPSAMSYLAKMNKEDRYAMPSHVLYPVLYQDRRSYFKRARVVMRSIQDDTQSIHFYGRRVRDRLSSHPGGVPKHNTILGVLGRQHGILLDTKDDVPPEDQPFLQRIAQQTKDAASKVKPAA